MRFNIVVTKTSRERSLEVSLQNVPHGELMRFVPKCADFKGMNYGDTRETCQQKNLVSKNLYIPKLHNKLDHKGHLIQPHL